jgi:hypothetical protein
MEELNVMTKQLEIKKKEYQRGIIVPNIHSQIYPVMIDINLSESSEELQQNLF